MTEVWGDTAVERTDALFDGIRARRRHSGLASEDSYLVTIVSSESPERIVAELERALAHVFPDVKVQREG